VDYPYPDDEFDEAADSGGHRGVHRAPRSIWAKLWPFLAVLIIFPALAVLSVNLMSRERIPQGPPAAASTVASPTAVEHEGSSAGATETDLPGRAEPSDLPAEPADLPAEPSDLVTEPPVDSPDQADPVSPAPLPTPIRSTPVEIYNAAGIQGIAAAGQERLINAGYANVIVGNLAEDRPEASLVYYAEESFEATAQEVADILAIPNIALDDGFLTAHSMATNGIVVIIVTDFR
jgi:hypothetical protein